MAHPDGKTPFFLASLRKTVYHVGRRKEALRMKVIICIDERGGVRFHDRRAVSYTHLDVYKRQHLHPLDDGAGDAVDDDGPVCGHG